MILWKRAVLLGLLSWLVPFLVSFLVFPLRQTNAPLFGNVMTLVVLAVAVALFHMYFLGRAVLVREALWVGALWLAINLVLDYPMFAFGPMQMPAARYYSEIGSAYLIFPLFAFGAAWLARAPKAHAAGA